MTTKTFGKRGVSLPAVTVNRGSLAEVKLISSDTNEAYPNSEAHESYFKNNDLLQALYNNTPVLTLGILLFLSIIFAVQSFLAFDKLSGVNLSIESLVSLGGTNYDLVVGQGQIWRLFTAPLLHASPSHIIGNSIALLLIGISLELRIGKVWYLFIFLMSGLCGSLFSIYNNPTYITGVGASGAIMGLVAALFVVSFHMSVDPRDQMKILRKSLFFGLPAVVPLLWAASDGTDYYAHLGGAIAGASIAAFILIMWKDNDVPVSYTPISFLICGSLLASISAVVFIILGYGELKATALRVMPQDRFAELLTAATNHQLTANQAHSTAKAFPDDARGPFLLALYYGDGNNIQQFETEMKRAIALSKLETAPPSIRPMTELFEIIYADALFKLNKPYEAKKIAEPYCTNARVKALKKVLIDDGLCAVKKTS